MKRIPPLFREGKRCSICKRGREDGARSRGSNEKEKKGMKPKELLLQIFCWSILLAFIGFFAWIWPYVECTATL